MNIHGGKPRSPGHWHRDSPISLPAGDFNTSFAVGGGVTGGVTGATFSDDGCVVASGNIENDCR